MPSPFVRPVTAAVALALGLAMPAAPVAAESVAQPARSLSGPLYVIVPFGEPGESDPRLRDATDRLTHELSDRGVRSALTEPRDSIEAVGTAPDLCAKFDGSGLLIGRLTFEQTKERNLTGFIPVVGGVVSASGAFDASPIRAKVALYLVDCRGRVTWKTYTTADKVHHGTNVAAGLTQIEQQAIADAADRFANRR